MPQAITPYQFREGPRTRWFGRLQLFETVTCTKIPLRITFGRFTKADLGNMLASVIRRTELTNALELLEIGKAKAKTLGSVLQAVILFCTYHNHIVVPRVE